MADKGPAGPREPALDRTGARKRAGEADVETRLAGLPERPTRELRAEWRRLHRVEPPPRLSRDLLVRGIAYKIQEQAQGGPSAALKRRLRRLAEQIASGADMANGSGSRLRPGARLVREWRGATHSVIALEYGFEYEGKRYRSLSQIAKAITGAHWSGPRFFGLTKLPGKSDAADRSASSNTHDHEDSHAPVR